MSYQPMGWGAPQQGGEVTIYQDAIALVTSQRLHAGGAMYPIRNITSVGASAYKAAPDYSKAYALFGASIVSVVLAFAVHPAIFLATPVLIIVAVILGLVASGDTVYTVIVCTSGMQHPAIQTKDYQQRDAILAALHRAIGGG